MDAPNILYNDTTYVPLRKAAEILGKEVSWDGNTNTAYIQDDSSAPVQPVIPSSKVDIKEVKVAALIGYYAYRAENMCEYIDECIDNIFSCMDRIFASDWEKYNSYVNIATNNLNLANNILNTLNENKEFITSGAQIINIDTSGIETMYQTAARGIQSAREALSATIQYRLYQSQSDFDIIATKIPNASTNILDCEEVAVTLHLDTLDYIVNYPEE